VLVEEETTNLHKLLLLDNADALDHAVAEPRGDRTL